MHLVPTHEDVVGLLRRTGGLREGHFEYNNGLHANEYLQVALTMRYYEVAKILSVGLSRKLRANSMWAFYDWIRDSVKRDKVVESHRQVFHFQDLDGQASLNNPTRPRGMTRTTDTTIIPTRIR